MTAVRSFAEGNKTKEAAGKSAGFVKETPRYAAWYFRYLRLPDFGEGRARIYELPAHTAFCDVREEMENADEQAHG